MRLLLLSSSYIENLLVYNINYLIDYDITEIVLLRENHVEFEHSTCSKYAITLCDSLLDATDFCDIALIITPPRVDRKQFEAIFDYTKKHVFKSYFVDLNVCEEYSNNSISSNTKNIPTILILSIGRFNHILELEMYLNELLSLKKVSFCQDFSPLSSKLLKELNSKGILRSSLIDNGGHTNDILRISTLCRDTLEEAYNDLSLLESICTINPFYIFVVAERNNKKDLKCIENLQIRLNYKIDSILFSNYFSVLWEDNYIPILASKQFSSYIKIDDREKMWKDIIKNIAFPEGLSIIRTNR